MQFLLCFFFLPPLFLSHFLHHRLKIQYQEGNVQQSELSRNPRYEANIGFAFFPDLSKKPECEIKKEIPYSLSFPKSCQPDAQVFFLNMALCNLNKNK
jgi:hypothetical protein